MHRSPVHVQERRVVEVQDTQGGRPQPPPAAFSAALGYAAAQQQALMGNVSVAPGRPDEHAALRSMLAGGGGGGIAAEESDTMELLPFSQVRLPRNRRKFWEKTSQVENYRSCQHLPRMAMGAAWRGCQSAWSPASTPHVLPLPAGCVGAIGRICRAQPTPSCRTG